MSGPGRIVFIGDSHMSELVWRSRPAVRWDAFDALASVMRAERGKACAAVFCGDSLDSRRPAPEELARMAEALAEGGMPVFHIQGNHDKCRGPGWMSLVGSASLHGSAAEIGGMSVRGVDHCGHDELEAALEGLCSCGGCSVLVLHQSLAEAGSRDPGCLTKADIPACVSVGMVVGHTHNPHIGVDSDGRCVVSPGCTHRRKVDEPPGSYAVLEGGKFSILPVPSGRRLVRMTASEALSLDQPMADGPLVVVSGPDPEELARAAGKINKSGGVAFPQFEGSGPQSAAKVSVGELCRLEGALEAHSGGPDMTSFLLEACSEGISAVDARSALMRSDRIELEGRLSNAQAARDARV